MAGRRRGSNAENKSNTAAHQSNTTSSNTNKECSSSTTNSSSSLPIPHISVSTGAKSSPSTDPHSIDSTSTPSDPILVTTDPDSTAPQFPTGDMSVSESFLLSFSPPVSASSSPKSSSDSHFMSSAVYLPTRSDSNFSSAVNSAVESIAQANISPTSAQLTHSQQFDSQESKSNSIAADSDNISSQHISESSIEKNENSAESSVVLQKLRDWRNQLWPTSSFTKEQRSEVESKTVVADESSASSDSDSTFVVTRVDSPSSSSAFSPTTSISDSVNNSENNNNNYNSVIKRSCSRDSGLVGAGLLGGVLVGVFLTRLYFIALARRRGSKRTSVESELECLQKLILDKSQEITNLTKLFQQYMQSPIVIRIRI